MTEMSMTEASALKAQFEEAKSRVQALTRTPSPAELLELYALFKQASQGDVRGERPGALDFKGRAKFDAWTTKRGMTAEVAMQEYVATASRLVARYG
jgi:acyl-CoA-binding protein